MKKLNRKQVLELINNNVEYARRAINNAYKNKVFVVLNSDRIDYFAKTKRGAESYIKKQGNISYYDEYTQKMINCGDGLYIVEICILDVVDFYNDTKIWYEELRSAWKHNFYIDSVLKEAKRLNVNENIIKMLEFLINDIKINSGLYSYEDALVKCGLKQEAREENVNVEKSENEVVQVQEVQKTEVAENDLTVEMILNEKMNGIELYFSDKPSEEVRELLKSNGFRWSKRGFWYAKQNEDTLKLAEQLTNENIKESEPVQVELLEFDDIEQYAIDEKLENRLNSITFYPREVGFYTKDLQETFKQKRNAVVKVVEMTDNVYFKNRCILLFNRFMKKYYNEYVSYLNMKANNPSWIITGRGNLNVSRYNKKQDQLFNKMGKTVEVVNKFEKDLKQLEYKIINYNQQQEEKEISKMSIDNVQFEVKTVNRKRVYICDKYFIMKSGYVWAIYDLQTNREIKRMKTTQNLDDAKRYVFYLINKDRQQKAV